MKKVIQITDAMGQPIGGRVFIAPDTESLNLSIQEASLPSGCWREVASEEDLVIPPPPLTDPPL